MSSRGETKWTDYTAVLVTGPTSDCTVADRSDDTLKAGTKSSRLEMDASLDESTGNWSSLKPTDAPNELKLRSHSHRVADRRACRSVSVGPPTCIMTTAATRKPRRATNLMDPIGRSV